MKSSFSLLAFLRQILPNFILGFCLLLSLESFGQQAAPQFNVPFTEEKIILDGELTEEIWKQGHQASDFWQFFPTDTLQAKGQTEIYFAYDNEYVYVATKCYSSGDDYVTPSLRRDYRFPANDNISIMFDTFNDQTNAFLFGLNPFGVRREALISGGGFMRTDFQGSWDNKWRGDAKIHGDFWIAEFAIPFKTLRFQPGGEKWRFNAYRFDTQLDEASAWIRVPQNLLVMNLGYMGEMHFEKPLGDPGSNISFIPYLSGGASRDFEDPNQTETDFMGGIGGDAKVAITSGLNLDLTVNPDFSQVEVDQQVTNLDRFELFFPERRQFFLENADLFGGFGMTRVRPFFSRRIGVARDTTTGQNIQNPIQFGARLSGKLNDRLRVGLLNMQTAALPEQGQPVYNYTVAAVQQQVFKRSNIAFLFTNKQAMGLDNNENIASDFSRFDRVAGIEYRLNTPDNSWTGKAFYHHAFTENTDADHKFTTSFQIEHLKRNYRLEWAQLFVGQGFESEVGFVPRRDFMIVSPEFQLFFYPKTDLISQHGPQVDTRFIYKPGKDGNTLLDPWSLSDQQIEASWDFQFKDFSQAQVLFTRDYQFLLNDFDPTRQQAEGISLQAGTDYTWFRYGINYSSDQSKRFFFEVQPTFGGFYNGNRTEIDGSFTWRYQPYGFVSLAYTYNRIELADPFEPVNLWLVGPRIDLTFSKSLFLTTFIQYNSQFDNLNINARFQWRFAPVSDFFLVYTDNYLVDPNSNFSVRNRGVVAKLTYWLNL